MIPRGGVCRCVNIEKPKVDLRWSSNGDKGKVGGRQAGCGSRRLFSERQAVHQPAVFGGVGLPVLGQVKDDGIGLCHSFMNLNGRPTLNSRRNNRKQKLFIERYSKHNLNKFTHYYHFLYRFQDGVLDYT